MVPELLENEVEIEQWNSWISERKDQLRQTHLQSLINQGLDQVMQDVADAFQILAAETPKEESQNIKNLQKMHGLHGLKFTKP